MSTETEALKVFEKALKLCRAKMANSSGQEDVLASVEQQLEYLIGVVTPGTSVDRSRLKEIILAIYSVREFDGDPVFADLLSQADNYARILRSGTWKP